MHFSGFIFASHWYKPTTDIIDIRLVILFVVGKLTESAGVHITFSLTAPSLQVFAPCACCCAYNNVLTRHRDRLD